MNARPRPLYATRSLPLLQVWGLISQFDSFLEIPSGCCRILGFYLWLKFVRIRAPRHGFAVGVIINVRGKRDYFDATMIFQYLADSIA